MSTLLDRIRVIKDLVTTVLGALAAAGFVVIDDSVQAAVWTAVFAVASLVVTLVGGGNAKPAASEPRRDYR